jgi:minor extracellular serine protease Vpr
MNIKRMQPFLLIALVLALVLSSFGSVAANPNAKNASLPELAEIFGDIDTSSPAVTTVIVELKEESVVQAKHNGKRQTKANLQKERNKVLNEAKGKVKNLKVNREYDFLFSGFAVELPANQIPQLLDVAGVKAIYPNVEYTVDAFNFQPLSADEISASMFDSAPFIGSDKAWDKGFTGKGIKVAILDTGVDYTHPDLVHAFGDYKGWDFVDNNNSPQETPVGDPRGGSTNHGTHVAGTVAANGDYIKGVAPEATLLSYRVLGPGGSGSTQNVIAGIERAVQDGADVMNLSLGNRLNNPDFATSIALDWAMAEGVVAVTSNGNSGPTNWTVGSPGTSREAISVGATQLPYNHFSSKITTSAGVEYPSAKVMGFPSEETLLGLNTGDYEFVFVNLARPQDLVGVDLTGKIALIIRGEIPFVDKATNVKEKGAVGAIMYNHLAGEMPDVPGLAVPTIKLTNADGLKLQAELVAGNNKVKFENKFERVVDETMADFSSRGPVVGTWMIKPDVSAPGVAIVSTVPTHNTANPYGYASLQGTSMAAPHVAGAAALILQANPKWNPEQVKSSLMNTAVKLYDFNGNLYPHNTQGAGSIRPLAALEAKTLIKPGSHSYGVFFKDEEAEVRRQSFVIENLSDKRQRYSYDVSFKGNPDGIKVLSSKNLVVQANSTQTVQFSVHVDASKLASGYYEGNITITNGVNTFDVPTILIVRDTQDNYPRISSFDFSQQADGSVTMNMFLPFGAERVEIRVYRASDLAHIALVQDHYNLAQGTNQLTWDGKSVAGTTAVLPTGNYRIAAWATKNGVRQHVLADQVLVVK